MYKYNSIIINILYNNTTINEIGICNMIAEYCMNPVKYFLLQKFNKYYIIEKKYSLININKFYFTFDDMSDFFNEITRKLGHTHSIIHFTKTNDIIELYYNSNNIKFKIKEDNNLYLQPETIESKAWPYKNPVFLFDLYLNHLYYDNILLETDILFKD